MGFLDAIGDLFSGDFAQAGQEAMSGIGDIAKQVTSPGGIGDVVSLAGAGGNLFASINAQNQAGEQLDMQKKAEKQAVAATDPLRAGGSTVLAAGNSAMMGGNLPPNLEAQVQQMESAQIQQIRQTMANMGLAGSTMEQQMIEDMKARTLQYRNQIAQNLAQTGQSEISAGVAPLAGVAATAGNNVGGITNSVTQAQGAINKLMALGSTGAQTTGDELSSDPELKKELGL